MIESGHSQVQVHIEKLSDYIAPTSFALGGLIFAPHLIPSVANSLAITNQLIAFLNAMPYTPYDLFNYLAGALQIKLKPFMLATVLGSIPSTISFVLLGASIKGGVITGIPHLNPSMLAASGVIFVSSLTISHYRANTPKPIQASCYY